VLAVWRIKSSIIERGMPGYRNIYYELRLTIAGNGRPELFNTIKHNINIFKMDTALHSCLSCGAGFGGFVLNFGTDISQYEIDFSPKVILGKPATTTLRIQVKKEKP
jgi:hypothetical protein